MEDYLTTFREAVYDAIAVYVNPRDFNEHLSDGLGSDFIRTNNIATLMGGAWGRWGLCGSTQTPAFRWGRSVGW